MLWFRDNLAVHFKDQFGMTGGKNVIIHVLVAGHTGIGSDVKVVEVAHADVDAVLMREIGARVGKQPFLSAAMAIFAGNSRDRVESVAQSIIRGNRLERRVANGAALALNGIAELQHIRDARGTGQRERGIRARVNIKLRVTEALIMLFARAAMATGGTARRLAKKRSSRKSSFFFQSLLAEIFKRLGVERMGNEK